MRPHLRASHPPFPKAHFWAAILLFGALTLLFWFSDLDRRAAAYFFQQSPPWPGLTWTWTEWFYTWGQLPATAVGLTGLVFFGLSFSAPQRRGWRGPGLYLALLLLLGPGLMSNVLGKSLAGRPRPEETWGFGGLWPFLRPLQFGVPGQGRSFLSGHASNAWYFLGFPFLLKGRGRAWAWAGAVTFGMVLCFVRVSQGAHWLSDTLLAGAGLYAWAAGLSPLIHWQPSAAFFRQPRLRRAVGLGVLAWLSVSAVGYEGLRFIPHFDSDGPLQLPLPPQLRPLTMPSRAQLSDVMTSIDLAAGDLKADFDADSHQIMVFDLEQRSQGLPASKPAVDWGALKPGGAFAPGPGTFALQVSTHLRGLCFWTGGSSHLSLPAALPVDARLRTRRGAINIGALPLGRRVLLARVPRGTRLPPGFTAYGSQGWLRDGQPPLIALDLEADSVTFEEAP